MLQLYAAIGVPSASMATRTKDLKSTVERKGLEFFLSQSEFILWTTALWNIFNYDELAREYKKRAEQSGMATMPFDRVLEGLLERKLLLRGSGETGVDALYDLLSRTFVEPFQVGWRERIASFFRLTFLQGVSIGITRNLFREPKKSPLQLRIWKLVRRRPLSTAELIRCIDLGVEQVMDSSRLVEDIYSDVCGVDYMNIGVHARLSEQQTPVLEAVAQLYLHRQISLDTCE